MERLLSQPSRGDGIGLIIGQERALRALELGIGIRAKGYNIFVTGLPGTGKQTTIMRRLRDLPVDRSRLRDIAAVYNFSRPENPGMLYFPPGGGRRFKKALHQMVENLKTLIRSKLASGAFTENRDRIVTEVESAEARALSEFETRLAGLGLRIVQMEEEGLQSTDIMPVVDGKTVDFDELRKLEDLGGVARGRAAEIREQYYRSMDEMKGLFQELRKKRSEIEAELESLRVQVVEMDVRIEIDHIRAEFQSPEVEAYLDAMHEDILDNLYIFAEENPPRDPSGSPAFVRYGVNVLVDHSATEQAPIVFESHPDYPCLFGTIESVSDQNGEARSNFMMIRPGSLIRASGGFLVLRAEDVATDEEVWNNLKRSLQDGRAEIRPAPGPFGPQPTFLKPQPVNLDVKVIVLGNEGVYDALYNTDEDFPKLFKVCAEFDSVMDRCERSASEYVEFLRRISAEEGLLEVDASGAAAILEFGVRLSEFRDKLSTRFSQIADLLREADYWARRQALHRVTRAAVERALQERRYLSNLPEEKIDEQILSGEILMQLAGSAVGRVNGLAVLDRGYYTFGRPLVISARTAPGHDGIINIERESGLSGEIHDKGVLIIGGYLQAQYARDFPLSMRASICFEQSYIEVDGDSASAAEVFALLSAISALPLRQDVAVTGSVSQMGEIQPVGGVSEKIEGFFEICRKTGLTGTQGVVIPRLNLPNLILAREVQSAMADGSFRVWTVSTVDEGMEILTGLPAGVRSARGTFPAGSVNALVEKRLREMALQVKDFGGN